MSWQKYVYESATVKIEIPPVSHDYMFTILFPSYIYAIISAWPRFCSPDALILKSVYV